MPRKKKNILAIENREPISSSSSPSVKQKEEIENVRVTHFEQTEIELTDEFRSALDAMENTNEHLFITGNAGTILEKHLSLSKATDSEYSVGSPSYWRNYLSSASSYIFGGGAPTGLTASGFSNNGYTLVTNTGWDQATSNVIFGTFGATTYTLNGGLDYNGQAGITTSGSLTATLGYLSSGYQQFINNEQKIGRAHV